MTTEEQKRKKDTQRKQEQRAKWKAEGYTTLSILVPQIHKERVIRFIKSLPQPSRQEEQ